MFGSIVKMQKKQQCSGLSATSIDKFVGIFNFSKLYICIIIFTLFVFFQNNHYLIIITIAGCGFFFVVIFFLTTIKKKIV